jgi:hypothetical protein
LLDDDHLAELKEWKPGPDVGVFLSRIVLGMHLTPPRLNPAACEHRVCRWLGVDGLLSQTIEKLSA